MKIFILAAFVFVALIQNPSFISAQDETPQNLNKLLNNQVIVSR